MVEEILHLKSELKHTKEKLRGLSRSIEDLRKENLQLRSSLKGKSGGSDEKEDIISPITEIERVSQKKPSKRKKLKKINTKDDNEGCGNRSGSVTSLEYSKDTSVARTKDENSHHKSGLGSIAVTPNQFFKGKTFKSFGKTKNLKK